MFICSNFILFFLNSRGWWVLRCTVKINFKLIISLWNMLSLPCTGYLGGKLIMKWRGNKLIKSLQSASMLLPFSSKLSSEERLWSLMSLFTIVSKPWWLPIPSIPLLWVFSKEFSMILSITKFVRPFSLVKDESN